MQLEVHFIIWKKVVLFTKKKSYRILNWEAFGPFYKCARSNRRLPDGKGEGETEFPLATVKHLKFISLCCHKLGQFWGYESKKLLMWICSEIQRQNEINHFCVYLQGLV